MMRDVVLHGALGERFGERFRFEIASPAEALRALCAMIPGFRQHFCQGHYRVLAGSREACFRA